MANLSKIKLPDNQEINIKDATSAGLKVEGTVYTVSEVDYTAATGAEVFNEYTGNNKAWGQYSHAEGLNTTASGGYSHAEGANTGASGAYSHAEGHLTTAFAESSHAEGYMSYASAPYSHAEGLGTVAESQAQHVMGKYNVSDSNSTYAFIIGNGTDMTTANRHNAFAIDWNGLIYVNGATTGVNVATLASTIGDINSVLESVL